MPDGRDPGLRTRSQDRRWPRRADDHLRAFHISVRENWYRDLWLLVITGVVLVTVLNLNATNRDVQRGREFAIGVNCAGLNGVIAAGRDIILRNAAHAIRGRAQRTADRYSAFIVAAIDRQAGRSGASLVRRDGSIDCRRFVRFAVRGP